MRPSTACIAARCATAGSTTELAASFSDHLMLVAARSESHLTLRYQQLTVEVRASPSHLEWLTEFVCPHFELISSTSPDRRVALRAHREEYDALWDAGPSKEGLRVGCFAFDNRLLELPEWTALADDRVIFDDKFECFYCIAADGGAVTILQREDHFHGRIPLMRVVREWAMHGAMRSGCLVLHASAVAIDDQAIVITGPKRAGKTTLLIHALALPETAYLSNDRVIVSFGETDLLAVGMPTILTIRSSTLSFLPQLSDRLRSSRFHHHRTLGESERAAQRILPWNDGRYGLTPAQFCKLVDTSAKRAGHLQALFVPTITERPGGIHLVPISPPKAHKLLTDSMFGFGAWSELPDVFLSPTHPSGQPASDPREICSRLVERVPTFECRLGLQAFDEPAALGQLITEVLGNRRPAARRGRPEGHPS